MERWVEIQTEITSFHTELSPGTSLQTACVCVCGCTEPPVTVLLIDQSFGLCLCVNACSSMRICACVHLCFPVCVRWGSYSRWTCVAAGSKCVVCITSDHCKLHMQGSGPVQSLSNCLCDDIFENLNLNVVFLTYSVTASFDSVDRFDGVPGKPGFDGFRFSGCQPLCSPLRNSPYYLPAPNKTIANKQ